MKRKTIFSLVLIIALLTILIFQILDSIECKKGKENKTWSEEQIQTMIEDCMDDVYKTDESLKNYPEIVREYCECATDTMIKHFSYEEILEHEKMDKGELEVLIQPVVKDCMDKAFEKIREKK